MKCDDPDVFCCAILNAQPRGFYAPAQLVRDGREHGVIEHPFCVNASQWDCTLEPAGGRWLAVHLGLRTVRGLSMGTPVPVALGPSACDRLVKGTDDGA